MDTLETIFARRSVRKYKDAPIPGEHLKQILEAARQAPSAGNRQSWHFVIVRNAEQRRRTAEACNGQMWMADADCIIVALGLPQVSPRWHRVDAAIALQNLVLAARSLGYGTCWIGAFDPAELKRVCGIPNDAEVVACTPLGVPAVEPPARPRKEWDDLFSPERYGTPMEL